MLRRLAGRGPRPDDAIVVDGHVIPYRSLVEELPAMVYVDTAQDGFANVYVSPFSEQLTGYTPAEWRSDPEMFQKVLHPDDRDMLELEESSEGVQHEYRLIARDGREVWVRDTYVVVSADDGTPLLVQGVMQDITDRKRAEEQARSSERLFRDILEEVHLLAVIIDTDGRVVFCNDYTLEVLGWKREDLLGRRLSETIIAPDLRAAGRAEFLEAMKTGVIKRHGDVRVVTRDGEERIVSYNSTLMLGEDGTPSGMTTIAEDVTERRHAEERVQYLASYDQLTGLPNRTLFANWLDMALGCAAEQLRVVGVQFVSLDEFRLINSSLGHAAGDALMGMFADRLREAATGAELVARQGGDEFLILLADVDEETGEDSTHAVAADVAQMAEALTGRLRALLSRPFRWEGHDIYLSATVGTATVSRGCGRRRRADQAGDGRLLPGARRRQGLQPRSRGAGAGARAGADRGAAPGDRPFGVRAALPAGGAPGDRRPDRCRGAASLDVGGAGAGLARRLRAAGGAHRADRADHRVGGRRGVPAVAALARARDARSRSRSTSRPACGAPGRSAGCWRRCGETACGPAICCWR